MRLAHTETYNRNRCSLSDGIHPLLKVYQRVPHGYLLSMGSPTSFPLGTKFSQVWRGWQVMWGGGGSEDFRLLARALKPVLNSGGRTGLAGEVRQDWRVDSKKMPIE